MIGLIQHVLLDLVRQRGGDVALAQVLARAGLPADTRFRIDTDYDDAQAAALLGHAAAVLGVDTDTLFALYADAFLADTRQRFPAFFAMAKSSREFLARQPAIHNLMGSGLRNPARRAQINDKFHLTDLPGGDLAVRYTSPARWCGLYVALAHAVARLYGDRLELCVAQCRARGDAACTFHLHWPQPGGSIAASTPCPGCAGAKAS